MGPASCCCRVGGGGLTDSGHAPFHRSETTNSRVWFVTVKLVSLKGTAQGYGRNGLGGGATRPSLEETANQHLLSQRPTLESEGTSRAPGAVNDHLIGFDCGTYRSLSWGTQEPPASRTRSAGGARAPSQGFRSDTHADTRVRTCQGGAPAS